MVEAVLPLALTILEDWKNLNTCFLPGPLDHGLYLKPTIPHEPTFVDGYRKYWLI